MNLVTAKFNPKLQEIASKLVPKEAVRHGSAQSYNQVSSEIPIFPRFSDACMWVLPSLMLLELADILLDLPITISSESLLESLSTVFALGEGFLREDFEAPTQRVLANYQAILTTDQPENMTSKQTLDRRTEKIVLNKRKFDNHSVYAFILS